jgi:hypothetical protein
VVKEVPRGPPRRRRYRALENILFIDVTAAVIQAPMFWLKLTA